MAEISLESDDSKNAVGSAKSRVGVLLAGGAGVLAIGCLLGYLVRGGNAVQETERAVSGASGITQGSTVYAVAALVAVGLLFALLRSSKISLWRRSPFAGRVEKPVAQFVEEAKEFRISLRVARDAYHLLQHHYPKPMCVDLRDDLRRDLRMTAGDVLSLRAGLLGRTDRLEQDHSGQGKIATVRQLLESVEAAPKNGVDRAKLRQRVTDLPFASRPVVENLEFTATSALADPDFLRRAHFKWLRRRVSDYVGFRSRASDRAGAEGHKGPFRRGTELSRRLAVKQEAGRLAKLAAEKNALEQSHHEAGWLASLDERDPSGQGAFHGY